MSLEKKTFSGHFIAPPFFADELFCDLSPKTRRALQTIKTSKRVKENNAVLKAGDISPCVYILREGCARITYRNELNNSGSFRLIEENEFVGLNEILADSCCEMNVETVTPCTFECLRRKDFMNFLGREPEICFRLVKMLGAGLQKNYRKLQNSTF